MPKFTSDGFDYELSALKLRESRKVQLVLAKALGPLFSSQPDLARVLSTISDDDLELVTQTFAKVCTFDADNSNFRLDKQLDSHFSGRPLAYWKWLAECVRSEYEDFFVEGQKLLAKLRALLPAKTATVSESLTGLTGRSGDSQPATSSEIPTST